MMGSARTRRHPAAELGEAAVDDRPPRPGHEVDQVVQVMQGQQSQADDLVLHHQVADIGA